ncbi:Mov34/MPN/PAD-1 family protein [Hyphomonas sp.]|uniref:Mov34/MPN/PAD-1 family protein n=1 Tax=Hyphomonas sp. TaxID=87 RepID=UPI000E04F27C|nr:Mov34/MPN/PAD-1 family protein [Hyphomonas sp.]RCL90147.1 MAG: hypothetical protein DBW63_00165 [Hyphomonas sp.]
MIPKLILNEIKIRSDRLHPKEAGGFLLGFFKDDAIEVSHLTGPFTGDLATRTRFIRKDPRHKLVAVSEWLKSGRICTLVGDWHSHPNGTPVPSSIDTNTWSKMSKKQNRSMVGIIQGQDDTGVYWHPVNSEQSVSTNLVYEDGTCIIREPTLPP